MRFKVLSSGITIALFYVMSINIHAQNIYDSVKLIQVAKEIISDAGVCSFTTIDSNGIARIRAMDPFPVEDDMTVWMGTNVNSRKVAQITHNDKVNLYYITRDQTGYVVVYGIATLVNDAALKEKYWKKEWEDFYPDKEENYLLIKVVPTSMEVLSPKHGINNDPVTWKPPIVIFR